MRELAAEGLTQKEAADRLGITRQRVQQLAVKLGLQFGKGYSGTLTVEKLAAFKIASEARTFRRWGVDRAAARELRKHGILTAYTRQKNSARQRNFEWSLTFQEWYGLWLESGHIHQRGRGAGEYVLGRIDQTGPYAIGNVEVMLGADNIRNTRSRGGKPSEVPGVYQLYPNLRNSWVAKLGSKSLGHYPTQEAAAAARAQAMEPA